MAKLQGVGYRLRPGARSFGGDRHGVTSFPLIDTSVDPFAPGISSAEKYARMNRRYGEHRIHGVGGVHSNVIAEYMRIAFAARRADWITDPADYDRFDGEPKESEYTDAYFSKDPRVHPLASGSTGGSVDGGGFQRRPPRGGEPAPQPEPQPAPDPPPAVTPPEPPVTPPVVPPAVPPLELSSVEQRVRELLALIDRTITRAVTPPWVGALWSASRATGLADLVLSNAVRVKRRILDEES